MKKIIRITLIILLVILIIIQFIRPEKNISGNVANDITTKYAVPDNLMQTLKPACYDCHSNNSAYPWYWNLQPVAWFMNGHIDEGKHHLNFSEFTSYNIGKQYKKLEEIGKEVKSGDMPLTSYTLIHTDARLSDEQKTDIQKWVATTRKDIEIHYPPDSLISPKK
ncbi:MAG: heme-binding domain-containing protein [Ginsengibacter sp.]